MQECVRMHLKYWRLRVFSSSCIQVGKLDLTMTLATPLKESMLLFAYGIFSESLFIDRHRSISMSYIPGSFS